MLVASTASWPNWFHLLITQTIKRCTRKALQNFFFTKVNDVAAYYAATIKPSLNIPPNLKSIAACARPRKKPAAFWPCSHHRSVFLGHPVRRTSARSPHGRGSLGGRKTAARTNKRNYQPMTYEQLITWRRAVNARPLCGSSAGHGSRGQREVIVWSAVKWSAH